MMGQKVCFHEEIWLIIPLTPSYLEHCILAVNEGMQMYLKKAWLLSDVPLLQDSDLGLHCLCKPNCRNIWSFFLQVTL